MDYLDFEVELSPGESGDYEVNVRSEFGEATGTFRLPFDDLALQNRLQALQIALLRAASSTRGVATPDEKTVETFGRELFEALFQEGPVRGRFEAARDGAEARDIGLRVKLRIDAPDLAALPWEYLFDPERGDFLGLSIATPLVRYIALPRPVRPLAIRPPLRILGLIASTPDLPNLDVDRERQRLEVALQEPSARGQVELEWLPTGTWRDLQTALLDGPWHIFHFIGHGGFDAIRGEGYVYVPDESGKATRLSATGLGRLLGDHDAMRLAVLNSCEGARGDAIDVFSSTAATVVQRGTPGVVAMQYQITDRAAIEFSRSFYTAIAGGTPIDTALAVARKSISLEIPGTLEWGTPALFMRAQDGVLFEVEPGQTSSAAPAEPVPTPGLSDPSSSAPDPITTMPPPPADDRPLAAVTPEPVPIAATFAPGAAAASAAAVSGLAASDSTPGEVSNPAPDPLASTVAAAGTGLSAALGTLGVAVRRGGYLQPLLGAELGAVAALIVVPRIEKENITYSIKDFLWPEEVPPFVPFLITDFLRISLWLGIVAGAFVAMRLFRVADALWTTFLLAIVALVLVWPIWSSDITDVGYASLDTFDRLAGQVVLGVAFAVVLARAVTRLGRNGRF